MTAAPGPARALGHAHPPGAALALGVALALGLAACGTSGTDLRDPPVGMTAPAPSSSTTPPTSTAVFAVASPAISAEGLLAVDQTCAGAGTAPAVTWVSVPAGTVELAVVVASRSPEVAVHWLVTGIDPSATGIGPGPAAAPAMEGPNSAGGTGWDPPCPNSDQQLDLDITLYALTEPSALPTGIQADEALAGLDERVAVRTVATARIEGRATDGGAVED